MQTEKDVKGLTNELCDGNVGTTPQQFCKDGNLIQKPLEMANLQLDYYINKVESLMRKITESERNPHSSARMET